VMDGMPKSPSYGNKAEEKLVSHADELYYIACCEGAIESLDSANHRLILTSSYLTKRYSDQQIMDKLFLSKAQYYRTKREALIAFAEICPLVEIEMRPL
jgi:ArpU family phage transcriptional regulator